MSLNPVKEIYKFNKEAGLLKNGYDDFLECSMSIEESLEDLGVKALADTLGVPTGGPKEIARRIMDLTDGPTPSDVQKFDKHLDAIIINFGSIFKLGLTPQEAMAGLSVVMQANLQKLHMPKDEHGKLMKPEGFVGPEVALQKILNKRNQ